MSWATCYAGSNNIHFDFPPIITDGRNYAKWQPGAVITPNQIEPYPSMFKQFHIKDLGRTFSEFDLETFWLYDYHYASGDKKDESGYKNEGAFKGDIQSGTGENNEEATKKGDT